MNRNLRNSFIAIGFGVVITVVLAVVNHGSVEAMKTASFWGEIGYALLIALILTAILYIFVANRGKTKKKRTFGGNQGGSRTVKRSKGKGKSQGKKKKKKK